MNFCANLVKQVLDRICDIEVAVLITFEWRKKRYSGRKRDTIIALSANRFTEEFVEIDTAMSFISSLYHIAFCLESRVKKTSL